MPTKRSEQIAKQRAKFQRVELLFRPEDYNAIKAAEAQNMTISAYIKNKLNTVNRNT